MPTKTDIAIREIRRRIIAGEYKKETRLRQNELVEDLKLGVTPVREALMHLVSEGLLYRKPYAGVVVTGISRSSVAEVYEVRKVLERHATEIACSYVKDDEIEQLAEFITQMEKAHDEDNDRKYEALNQDFHMKIYEAGKNKRLRNIIKEQWTEFPRSVFGLDKERRKKSLEEHRSILRAIERKDSLTAGGLVVSHISNSEERLLAMLTT